MRSVFFILSIGYLAMSCQKNNKNKPELKSQGDDYVAVVITGMIPNATVYLISEEQIRKDSLVTQIAEVPNNVRGRILSDADFQKGKYIFDNLPQEIFSDTNQVYGCPNCADGGAINFIIRKNGQEKKLSVEWSPGTYPEYLKDYMEELKRILHEI